MATTNPDNIWTPDSGDDYALTTDLAATADTIQDALTRRANYFVGTTAELAGYAATAPEGASGYDTTLEEEVRLVAGSWVVPGVPPGPLGPLAVPDHTTVTGVEGMVVTNTTSKQTYVYLDGAWRWVPANHPRLAMSKNTTQSVASSTEATVTYTSTAVDTGGFNHSAGTFTALRDGFINIRVGLTFSAGSAGTTYQVRVPRNSDAGNIVLFHASNFTRTATVSATSIPVSAGDQFKLRVFHNSTSALTVTQAFPTEPIIDFMYVG